MDIKEEFKGQRILSKRLGGMLTLNEKNKEIFIREGRFDLFESTGVNDLKPIKDLKVSDLREKAKELGIDPEGLKKAELVKAINDLP